MYEMLSQSKSGCNMCVITTPLKKLEKRSFNIWFFFIIHLLIEISVLVFFFPITNFIEIDSNNMYVLSLYLFVLFALLAVYIFLIFSDPGILKKKEKLSLNLEKDILFSFCPFCKIKKTQLSKHCIICNACVDGFDHHCYWVNNCIGKKNYTLFLLFLFLVLLNISLNIGISILGNNSINKAFSNHYQRSDILLPKLPFDIVYTKNFIQIISSLILIISIIFIIPVM